MSNTGGIIEGNTTACNESTTTMTTTSTAVQQNSINSINSTTARSKWKCVSKECLTCLLLSAIVIGLPIAIIKILINLPKLSSRGDTRQQHYILLAFGLPFTLVFIVAVIYGSFRLVMRLQRGSDQSLRLRSSNASWRHLSRKQRCHHLHQKHINETDPIGEDSSRFYSLVTQVMASQQVFPETQFSESIIHRNHQFDGELINNKPCINIEVNSDCDCDRTRAIGAHTVHCDTLYC